VSRDGSLFRISNLTAGTTNLIVDTTKDHFLGLNHFPPDTSEINTKAMAIHVNAF
jgi:hypothetical protein